MIRASGRSRRRAARAAASLLALALPAALAPRLALARAQDGEFRLDRAAVARAAAEVLPWVEEACGVELAGKVKVRLGNSLQLAGLLEKENLPLLEAQLRDPDLARAQARAFAASLASALLAKYAFDDREVIVSKDGFERLAAALSMPELRSEPALRAVLVHELVHAADDLSLGMGATFRSLRETDRIEAFNAVIEGHAQLVARRILGARGGLAGLDTVDLVFAGGRAEPDADAASAHPLAAQLRQILLARFLGYYAQGERFMRAIEEAGGAPAVERAFQAPPASMAVVFEPAWFLDPALEPPRAHDLGAILDGLASGLEGAGASLVQRGSTWPELDAALGLAPAGDRAALLASLRSNRSLTVLPTGSGAAVMHVVLLLELASASNARRYVELAESITRRKDELMSAGLPRIVGVERVALGPAPEADAGADAPARIGFVEHKRVDLGPLEQELVAACAAQGVLAVEIAFPRGGATLDDARALLDRVFELAARHRRDGD